jgi:Mg/Co/Ni transporter MgtE
MREIQTRLEDAIHLRDFAGLRDAVEGLPPWELAQLIGEAPGEQQATVFRVLPRATAAATFEYLPHDKQEELRLGFDPASSSAPFVATLVDVTGLVIYFSVAAMILRGTLL